MQQSILEIKRRLARLLVEKSYREGDFVLASGRRSDYYFDCRVTALHAEGSWLIGTLFNDLLKDVPVVGVGGMTMGADPLVSATTAISHELGRPLNGLLVRKEAKDHGTGQFVEGLGNFKPGDKVAMLEDVVTTGGSLLKACDRVRAAGLDVYADEPATNKALYSHPMVSCTPHIGAATVEAQKRIGTEIVDIIKGM